MILIDRYLFADQNDFVLIELHGYCDTSKTAYSAVIYARTIYKGKMTVEFVSAKLRVVSMIRYWPCGGSRELIKYGRFGWKIELEKLEKRLTEVV